MKIPGKTMKNGCNSDENFFQTFGNLFFGKLKSLENFFLETRTFRVLFFIDRHRICKKVLLLVLEWSKIHYFFIFT